MLDKKKLKRLLLEQESDRLEFTTATNNSEKFGQAVCAFANDMVDSEQSAYLLIGVKNNGELSGLKVTDDLLLNLSALRSDGNILPQPIMSVSKFSFDKGDVAVVEVKPSKLTPVRYKGKVWIRVGPRKAIANESEERILIEKRISQATSFDALPCLDAKLDDINVELFLNSYLPKAIDASVLKSEIRNIEQQLASLRFFDLRYNCPTYAAIILFGKKPEYFLSGSYLQYVKFLGDNLAADIGSEFKYSGNLLEMLPKLDSFVETSVSASRPIAVSALREDTVRNYPYWGIRELLMNAVMHRDYQSNTPARFYEFQDKIVISNPGNLYGNARPENFPNVNDYRNPIISEAMKVLGFVNKFSRGVFRVFQELEQNGNNMPTYNFSLLSALSVTVYASKYFLIGGRGVDELNLINPQLHHQLDDSLPQLEQTDPQTDPQLNDSHPQLGVRDFKILEYCVIEHSALDLSKLFEIKDKSYFRKKHIMPLVEKGVLQMTIPDKPNSRSQKYVITNLGLEILKLKNN